MEFVQYEVTDRIGVITLDRGDKANAQNAQFLGEIDRCWRLAAADAQVRVVLVQANGPHFSAGMDLSGSSASVAVGSSGLTDPSSGLTDASSHYNADSMRLFDNTLAWRNLPKPSIAAVQGKCVAAGLMLCWPCDLIVAADDAQFSDPTMRMGLAGIEYMAHVWELGARRAKEMLLRSTPITAGEAKAVGMVNKVVPGARLRKEAMMWARDIAGLNPAMTAMIKRAINGTLDTQGFSASIAHGFDLQELAYAWQADARRAGAGDAVVPDVLQQMRRTNAAIARRETGDHDGSAGR